MQLKERIMMSADKLPTLEGKVKSGGRLNLLNAFLYRPPQISISKTNDNIEINTQTTFGDYKIESSQYLSNWSTFTNIMGTNNTYTIAPDVSTMFYRIKGVK